MTRETLICQHQQYAWRRLLLARSFASIALVNLAFGIGVNTAVFYAVLLRPLPSRITSSM